MRIKILNANYKIGSQRGINFLDKTDAVEKLNEVIDWDNSIFPPNLEAEPTEQEVRLEQEGETRGCCIAILEAKAMGATKEQIDNELIPALEEQTGRKINKTDDGWYTMMANVYPENRDYLGNPPRLKAGNVFEYDGQLIAVDQDKDGNERLILYNTETGPLALDRIYREAIEVEYSMRNVPEDSVFDNLEIVGSEMIPFKDFIFFSEGQTRLDEIADEENDDALDNPWLLKKLDSVTWRYVLKNFPQFKHQLQDNIFELTIQPNFEDITVYIDKRGHLMYDMGSLTEEEFEFIYPCFWKSLWDYLKSLD